MTDWRHKNRTCGCGARFIPKREKQRHCSASCGSRDRMAKQRSRNKSGGILTLIPRNRNTPLSDSPAASEWDNWPICPVCKLWQMMPRKGLPRHLFCIAVRKARRQKPELAKAA
jgi:hypothetical protein